MLSSAVRTFDDPDCFATAISGARVDVTLTARGQFAASIVRVESDRLRMQRFWRRLPQISRVGFAPGRADFLFCTRPGSCLRWNGQEIRANHIIRRGEEDEACSLSAGPTHTGAVSIPLEHVATIAATAGYDLLPPRDTQRVAVPPLKMAIFQRLNREVGDMAAYAPEVIEHPNVARGLEQDLIMALVGCLDQGEAEQRRVAERQHDLIIRRFRTLLGDNPVQPLYVPEICSAIGVSERTLQACCQEHYGVGPKHYLLLRRLHLARQSLRKSEPHGTTVTEIATTYGFWHFGHFAREYRSLFGESPSITLARQPN